MLKRALTFIKYHNALPIGVSLILLSAGGALAASPEFRDSIVTAEQSVVSIDNSYIANVDLETYQPKIQITNVTEDEENYYVSYSFATIDLTESRWGEVATDKLLRVAKDALRDRDLGLYVTRELSEVVALEMTRLKETQTIEKRNGITQAVVATTYSGLIGKFLDPKEAVLPGYSPVITPPTSVASAEPQQTSPLPVSSSINPRSSGDNSPPSISILGNNPARIELQATYSDLGALITDNVNKNLGYSVALDGRAVSSISIDTTVAGEHQVTYTAIDQAGNTTTAVRTVIVYDPFAENAPTADSGNASEVTSGSTDPVVLEEQSPTLKTTPAPTLEPAPQETATSTTPTSSDAGTSSTTEPPAEAAPADETSSVTPAEESTASSTASL